MKRTFLSVPILSILLLVLFGAEALPADLKLPVIGGKPVLATVNGESLTLEEFDRALAAIHEGMGDNTAKSRSNPTELLDRLINLKLILQEARNIGLDALPEVTTAVRSFEENALRDMLFGEQVRKTKKADSKEVEKLYKDAVKEIKVKSLLFDKEEDAKRLEEELKAGGNFEDAANRMVAAGTAKGELEGQYLKVVSMLPEVAVGVSSLKEGEVSAPIKIGNRFTLVIMEGVRFPEDPEARKKAEKDALQAKRTAALKKYVEDLKKKYVKEDEKLVKSLDFEAAEPGFEKLLSDKRVLAKVKGDKPVTVGELANALQKRFFHGAERAAQEKKINRRKEQILEDIVGKRVVLKEARRKKLDRTEYFKGRVAEYRDGVLFGTFFQKAIDPDVKVTEPEVRAYLQDHIGEYTMPTMIRIDSIPFTSRKGAEDALEKLRKGAEFQWAKAYADGRLDTTGGVTFLEFGGNLLVVKDLPEGAQKAVSGASTGDYRIYGEAEGPHYVLYIKEVLPSKPQAMEAVKDEIEKKLLLEKRLKALHDWEGKLRKASTVKIFAKGENLDRIVKPHAR
jgi:parvulin-like peptidyl-prolyl isomerase